MELAEDGDLHARLKKQRGRPLKEDVILNCERSTCRLPSMSRHQPLWSPLLSLRWPLL